MAVSNGFNPSFEGPITTGRSVPYANAGSTTTAVMFFSDSGTLGLYTSAGTPAFVAAKGSLAINTAATTSSHRIFINTNGGSTWSGIASLS